MYKLLIPLIVFSALNSLGIKDVFLKTHLGSGDVSRLEIAKRKVLKIDWKPISFFPEEAKRFQ
ncbi:MAG: hypothetical protein LW875_03650 [Proteobacteria bacterium]|jgi:hypothetical protein|nr:hypothetical protein [Pseudomonadota bacterium]